MEVEFSQRKESVSSPQVELSRENHTKIVWIWGKPLKVKGKCKLPFKYKETREQLEFYVVSTRVLGLSSCLSLKLIKIILSVEEMRKLEQTKSNVLSEYSDVFEGLGTFLGTHKI